MSKIRAYRLAEELGIDRNEFVARAGALGIEIKSAMASLEDAEVQLLREKLAARPSSGQVVEERVERSGGAAVIRRRKRAVPEPEPVPAPIAVQPEAEPAPPLPAPEPLLPPPPAVAGEPEPEIVPAIAEPAAVAPEVQPEVFAARRPSVAVGEAAPRAADAGADAATKGKQRKRVREVVNLREQEQLAKQATTRAVARRPVSVDPRSLVSPRRKRRDALARPAPAAVAAPKPGKRVIRAEGEISVAELARQLGAKAAQVQGRLMALGTMASINQALDLDVARKVAAEFGFEVQDVAFREEEVLGGASAAEAPGEAATTPRAPIVTVMGHVDHGKTSLLDRIRKTNVVAGEAGGITQHIGAYQARSGATTLTFIDTPGHEAFTHMRARGAQVTDIVVLVVAANDGVMPQTVEAIAHAKAAGVPIVVAVNKTDLPDANPQIVRQRLMEHGLVPETFGGDVQCVDVSATKGTGIEQLLEALSLQAEILELRADPLRRATGVVLEAELDKGRGPVATVLVRDGTLRRGDVMVVGTEYGRIRAMLDEHGGRVDEAGPSVPVQVQGLSGVPEAGLVFHVVEDDRAAKQIAEHRLGEQRGRPSESRPRLSLDEILARAHGEGGVKELFVVLKADVQGSVEAVRDSLAKLSTDEVKVDVIHAGVGAITESDVMLARASGAIVVGFHVRPDPAARRAAEGQGVELRMYQIIYELLDDVRQAMAGLLPPSISERVLGRAEVRKIFNVPRVGVVAGCFVNDGLIRRNAQARLIRDGVQIHVGRFGSLKRFKEDVREVQQNFECGIGIEGYNDVKIGDVIEAFVVEEKPAEL
jgi:translation initiation factor IF-2